MTKIYVKEKSSGGLIARLYLDSNFDPGSFKEIDVSDLTNIKIDKARFDGSGKVYQDDTVITDSEVRENLRKSAILKLKSLGFSDDELNRIIR